MLESKCYLKSRQKGAGFHLASLLIFALFCSGNAENYPDTLHESATWGEGDIITISENTLVPVGVKISVTDGAVIKFDPGKYINVEGEFDVSAPNKKARFQTNGTGYGGWIESEKEGIVNLNGARFDNSSWGFRHFSSAPSVVRNSEFLSSEKYGIYNNGKLTVENSVFKFCGWGGRSAVHGTAESETRISNSVFFRNSKAVVVHGTNTLVENCLFEDQTTTALYIENGSVETDTVRNSIFYNNPVPIEGTIQNSHNNFWLNENEPPTLHSENNISENPLWVKDTYRLTHRSPSLKSGENGTHQGPYPWEGDLTPGFYGYLWSDTTLGDGDTVTFNGDLTVPKGVKLTLRGGAKLIFTAEPDVETFPGDRSKLHVYGTLDAVGTEAQPVLISGIYDEKNKRNWGGVNVEQGGELIADNLVVEKAGSGINLNTADPVSLSNIEVRDCYGYGIRSTVGSVNISDVWIHNNGKAGVFFEGGKNDRLTITKSLFTDTWRPYYSDAAHVKAEGRVTIDHCTFDNGGKDYGIYLTDAQANDTVKNSIIINHRVAIRADKNANQVFVYNNIWQNDTLSINTNRKNTIGVNPLFVGNGDYSLTGTSPSRFAGENGVHQGAFPWNGGATAGLRGHIRNDTTISGNVSVTGDLTILPGVKVTLVPGTTFDFSADEDSATTGKKSVLRVQGELIADGTKSRKISFTTSEDENSWEGIVVDGASAKITLDNCLIENALNGVVIKSDGNSVTHTTIRNSALSGIDTYNDLVVSNCTLVDNHYGIYTRYSHLRVDNTLIGRNRTGIYDSRSEIYVENSTIANNYASVNFITPSKKDTLINSIVSTKDYGLYNTGTDSASFPVAINCNIWGKRERGGKHYYERVSSICTNPLLEDTINFNLTHRSPGRGMGVDGIHQGAFPWAGALTTSNCGYIWDDTTFSGDNYFTGDITVAAGATVTVAEGAKLFFPALSDTMTGGDSTSLSELRVQGKLNIAGTRQKPVHIYSDGDAAGSWSGIIVGGTTDISHLITKNGIDGVLLLNDGSTIKNIDITNCSNFGIYSKGAAEIDGAKIYRNFAGGIEFTATGKRLTVKNSLIYKNDLGSNTVKYGIYVHDGSADIINCTVHDNDRYGINVRNFSSELVNVVNTIITSHEKGIYGSKYSRSKPVKSVRNVFSGNRYDTTFVEDSASLNAYSFYVDSNNDNYNLKERSTPIDAGIDLTAITEDILGTPRPLKGKSALRTDIGAYEYNPNANKYPVANAGKDTAVTLDEAVTYSGELSTDEDGTIVSYYWEFGDGKSGTGLNPVHTYSATGDYEITLVVTDDGGMSHKDTKRVHVTKRPTAEAGLDKYADVGEDVFFDASTSGDEDGSIVKWLWDFGDGNSSEEIQVTHIYTFPGTYDAVITVTDDDGSVDTDTTVVMVFGDAPIPPKITSDKNVNAKVGSELSYTVTATVEAGKTPVFTFKDTPSWLTANGAVISGTPAEGDGDTSFSVIVFDGVLSDTLKVAIAVAQVHSTQEITLNPGWSYISFNIEAENMSPASVFKDNASIRIVKDNAGKSFIPGIVDAIGTMNTTQAYSLYCSEAETITIIGSSVDEQSTISLTVGWNLIPYLSDSEMDAVEAFKSIKDNIEIVKDDKGGIYIPVAGINTIGTLKKGEGYKVYSNGDLDFTYPTK